MQMELCKGAVTQYHIPVPKTTTAPKTTCLTSYWDFSGLAGIYVMVSLYYSGSLSTDTTELRE